MSPHRILLVYNVSTNYPIMIKKAFKILIFLFLVLIIAAVAIPYFYKDEIVENVKSEINKNLDATVDFEDVSLSLFKSFPDFNFGLEDLSVVGIDVFNGYNLLKAKNINISFDFMSVISADTPLEINGISIVEPIINIKVLQNGKANYDIVKSNDQEEVPVESAEDLDFLIQLQKYKITNGTLVYDDRFGGTYLEIENLDHEGNGEFTQDIFDITTSTNIGNLTAKSGGITYLKKAKGDFDINLKAEMPNSKFTITENEIALNDLKLYAEGFVQMDGDNINMDIKYSAPKNNFKNLLSMIPSAYSKDFDGVDANGEFELDGYVKGTYDSKSEALPSFLLNLKVDNGDFKYPTLPLGVKGINTNVKINSPSKDLDKMVVDIEKFNMELGNNPFSARAKLWSIISDPHIDTEVDGTIDLSELSRAFPMEGVSNLNGILTSNLKANTSMSAIDSKNYENIEMNGDVSLKNLDYTSDASPRVQIENMKMNFSPKYVQLEEFDAQLGNSDIKAQGTIDNILAYFSPDKTMTGKISLRSNLFDANEWIAIEDTDQPSNETVNNAELEDIEIFDRFDFTVDGEINKVIYDIYELKNSKLLGNVTPNKVEIKDFSTNIGESDFRVNGKITNLFNYLFENENLRGDINLTSRYINANEFMVTEELPEESLEVIPVPENVQLNVNADIGEVLYTNIPLKSIKGKIIVNDEIASIKNGSAQTLGGNVILNGNYNTQNIKEPKFEMDYKVNSLDYQAAFDKLNTFKILAPIGEYIEGKFNTTLKMSGILGKDMLPDLTTLSADGFLQTIDGTLRNFEPVQLFADKLNLDALKSVNLKNTKNWFEVNNGKIEIKEFDYSTKGIDMVIGGTHGLDSDMAYKINAKVPRKILSQNAVGQAANKGLSLLQGQASKLGINLDQGEFVNLNATISGTMSSPKINIQLLGTDGETVSIDKVVDQVKKQAVDKVSSVIEDKTGVDVQNIEEEIEEVKEDLSAKADAEIDALKAKSEANINKILIEAEKRAEEARNEAKKLSDKTKKEGYNQADALVEKAGSNIFKKKAAEIAAKKLKEETDKQAEQIIEKGNAAANLILEKAEKQANKLREETDKQAETIRENYK